MAKSLYHKGMAFLFLQILFIQQPIENVFTKTILGIPSTIMFMVIVTYYYLIASKKGKLR
ncbi:hypothetical protein KLF27_08285 [Clostridium perfringens]|uniref:hypothetical protein n=1 Tax=Clostridium perfringens TaxID=1502 RepID=UPI001CCA9CA3|nr:hypothetical protein [Clostridium perfringens]UBK27643.1 hypothetical protein KLF27_08285 [Clostridium perfringens]